MCPSVPFRASLLVAAIATLCLLNPSSASRVTHCGSEEGGLLGGAGRKLLAPGPCYGDFTDDCFDGSPDCCTQYDSENSDLCLVRQRPDVTCTAGFSEQTNVCIQETYTVERRRLLEPSPWTCSSFGNIYLFGGSVANDPVMTGFDSKKFLFEDLGEFPLVHEGEGWKVNATFSPVPVLKSGVDPKERSFTSAVKVTAPNGDIISCSLPALAPNTTHVQMMAQRAGSDTPMEATPVNPTLELDQMKGTGVPTWKTTPSGEWHSYVVACEIETPKMKIKVYQVSGWEEAQAKPEEHGWAAAYTWLNLDFQITKTLTAPVTGVLGDTYPKPHIAAGVEGGSSSDVEGPTARSLLNIEAQPLMASINGLAMS